MSEKIIAIYLRISKADKEKQNKHEKENNEEIPDISQYSNSITNQRVLVREFIENNFEKDKYKILEFADDGYSATTMDRPAMNELQSMVLRGMTDIIIVKDFSRFSRNYIEIGYYIEYVFPMLGIRFISINDKYDSFLKESISADMGRQFKGIINDYYCKELSYKIKMSIRQQIIKGKCIMARPPYGYWKSDNKEHMLIKDEKTAPVVEDIFNMYLNGMSAYAIARHLNECKTDSPIIRLVNAGLIKADGISSKSDGWSVTVILSILKNQVYVGDLVGNKSERIKAGSKRLKKNDSDSWIIVRNTHEPIIDRKDFEAVLKIMKSRSKKFSP